MVSKRIILDTNLWISFLISRKFEVVDKLIKQRKIILLFSTELIEEFIIVATRPKFKKYISKEDIDKLLTMFDTYGILIKTSSSLNICRDLKDNFLLDLAVDGNADFLVTSDEDLLILEEIQGIPIITFNQFIIRI